MLGLCWARRFWDKWNVVPCSNILWIKGRAKEENAQLQLCRAERTQRDTQISQNGKGLGSRAAEKYYREWATFESGRERCVKPPHKSPEAGRRMRPWVRRRYWVGAELTGKGIRTEKLRAEWIGLGFALEVDAEFVRAWGAQEGFCAFPGVFLVSSTFLDGRKLGRGRSPLQEPEPGLWQRGAEVRADLRELSGQIRYVLNVENLVCRRESTDTGRAFYPLLVCLKVG